MQAYHRTQSVKLARTIADRSGYQEIQFAHLAEALHLRQTEVDAELNAAFRVECCGARITYHLKDITIMRLNGLIQDFIMLRRVDND